MIKVVEVFSFVGEEKAFFYGLGPDGQMYFWNAVDGKWVPHKIVPQEEHSH